MATTTPMFLRQDVQVEPLVDQWYAWSHLIPPATAARNLTERHLRIMDSYVAAPQVHANAVKDPHMAGGPFIDYGGRRVEEIRALRNRTASNRAHLLRLSAALSELDAHLRARANGFSVEALYAGVPDLLRGYVELGYDLNNQPSFRLLEPLLYRSPYFDRSMQSLAFSITRGDDRPFVLSTPRLADTNVAEVRIGFDEPAIDDLFQLKVSPRPMSEIEAFLPIVPADRDLFASFFTSTPPAPYTRYDGEGARWRYFGHACVLVETACTSVLFDPVLSYTYESDISRFTYADLPDTIDYVLVTHNHQDHVLFETLLQLRHKVSHIIVPRSGTGALQDPSLKLLLQHSGFRNVTELGEFDTIDAPGVAITAIPFFGEHADLHIATKGGYLVRLQENTLLFLADSCNIEPRLYDHVHRAIGDVDVMFIGMECNGAPLSWLYGPLLTRPLPRAMDQSRRLAGSNYEQAQQLVQRFRCREVYVYAMGQEPWLNHVMSLKYTEASRPIVDSNRLIEDCRRRGIVAERLFGEKEILLARRRTSAVAVVPQELPDIDHVR